MSSNDRDMPFDRRQRLPDGPTRRNRQYLQALLNDRGNQQVHDRQQHRGRPIRSQDFGYELESSFQTPDFEQGPGIIPLYNPQNVPFTHHGRKYDDFHVPNRHMREINPGNHGNAQYFDPQEQLFYNRFEEDQNQDSQRHNEDEQMSITEFEEVDNRGTQQFQGGMDTASQCSDRSTDLGFQIDRHAAMELHEKFPRLHGAQFQPTVENEHTDIQDLEEADIEEAIQKAIEVDEEEEEEEGEEEGEINDTPTITLGKRPRRQQGEALMAEDRSTPFSLESDKQPPAALRCGAGINTTNLHQHAGRQSREALPRPHKASSTQPQPPRSRETTYEHPANPLLDGVNLQMQRLITENNRLRREAIAEHEFEINLAEQWMELQRLRDLAHRQRHQSRTKKAEFEEIKQNLQVAGEPRMVLEEKEELLQAQEEVINTLKAALKEAEETRTKIMRVKVILKRA